MSNIKKVTITLLVIAIFITALYFYRSSSINEQIKELDEQISKEEELITFIENELNNYEDLLTKEAILKFYSKIPAEEGYPQFLQDFNQISTKSNVAITSITSNIVVESDLSYQTLSYNIIASSNSYPSIRLFLQDLYDLERTINITDIQITSNNNQFISEFNIEIYYSDVMKGLIPKLNPVETYPPANKVNPFTY